jgi:hypothetical protein
VGRTPLDREIAGGAHALLISTDGYDPSARSLTVVSGVDETLDVELVRVPSKFPFRAAGWTAVAIGVAALAGGVWAESVDGQVIPSADAQKDIFGHCPNVRSTRVLAATLVGLGMASGTLGSVWLYLDQGAQRPSDGRPASTLGLGIKGRF